MRRTVSCTIDSDGREDVLVLVGDRPVAFHAPGGFQYARALADGGVRGVAALDLPEEPLDRLLWVGGAGLHGSVFDEAAGEGYVDELLASGRWCDVSELTTADLDGDGRDEIVGLDRASRRLRVLAHDGQSFTSGPPIPIPAGVSRVVPTRWTGGGAREFALLAGDTVEVVASDGSHVAGAYVVGRAVDAVAYAEPGRAAEALAVLSVERDGRSWLTVLRAGLPPELPVDVGSIDAAGLGSGDFDGDGWPDVAVSGATGTLEVLRHSTLPGASFSSAATNRRSIRVMPDGVDGTGQAASPVVVDVDHDGDPDFVVPVEGTRELVVQMNPWRDETALLPSFSSSSIDVDVANPTVQLDVDVPHMDGGTGPTGLEVQLWTELPDAGDLAHLGARRFVAVPPGAVSVFASLVSSLPVGDRFWIVLRAFREDAQGAVVFGPDAIFGYERSDSVRGGGTGGDGTGTGQNGTGNVPPPKGDPDGGGLVAGK